mgnify:CR=1 FL=1|jgi:hypothetical protein
MRKYMVTKRALAIAIVLGVLSLSAISIAIAASKSAFNLNSPAAFPVDI